MLNVGFDEGGTIWEIGLGREEIRGGDIGGPAWLVGRGRDVVVEFITGGVSLEVSLAARALIIGNRSFVDAASSFMTPAVAEGARSTTFLLDDFTRALFVCALVVLDGIIGPSTRGDCGNLVDLCRLKPAAANPALDASPVATEPVKAARDCALAASGSKVSPLDSCRACDRTPGSLLAWLEPRGGIIDTGLADFAGGGIVLRSSSAALRTLDSIERLASSDILELSPSAESLALLDRWASSSTDVFRANCGSKLRLFIFWGDSKSAEKVLRLGMSIIGPY